MKPIVRERICEESNYYALFCNGETLRFYIRDGEEMKSPNMPELYDISINNKCSGGCPYCYASAKNSGKNYENIVDKIKGFFTPMAMNERPFQIAVGGAGEPTEHPDFIPFMEAVAEMNVMPNYTTNGTIITDEILQCAASTCGGVAVSAHEHLPWQTAVEAYSSAGSKTNIHVVIGMEDTAIKLQRWYDQFVNMVDYFVLLPYIPQGRAKPLDVADEYDKMFKWLETVGYEKVAFGAYFFSEIEKRKVPAYTYDVHMFSSYLDMDEMKMSESSFHGTRPNTSPQSGEHISSKTGAGERQ